MPDDPEFRSALVGYLEWGSRLAVINSQPGADGRRARADAAVGLGRGQGAVHRARDGGAAQFVILREVAGSTSANDAAMGGSCDARRCGEALWSPDEQRDAQLAARRVGDAQVHRPDAGVRAEVDAAAAAQVAQARAASGRPTRCRPPATRPRRSRARRPASGSGACTS